MGFTFELVATLLEQNTLNNNTSIAGEQYLASDLKDSEPANIVTELDTADISNPEYSISQETNNNDDNSTDYVDEISRDIEPIPHEENITND